MTIRVENLFANLPELSGSEQLLSLFENPSVKLERIEVTDAETLYTDAQTTYIRTIYDYKIADAQLARAMGDTRVGVLKPGSIK